jgi:hypothetical protein
VSARRCGSGCASAAGAFVRPRCGGLAPPMVPGAARWASLERGTGRPRLPRPWGAHGTEQGLERPGGWDKESRRERTAWNAQRGRSQRQ